MINFYIAVSLAIAVSNMILYHMSDKADKFANIDSSIWLATAFILIAIKGLKKMKLIELLVQELPKRGGWPDGAVECCRHYGANSIDFYDDHGNWPTDCSIQYGEYFAKDAVYENTHCYHQSVTREQYEAALAASKEMLINKPQPVWNGDGLPPAGCECEFSWAGEPYRKCRLLFITKLTAVIEDLSSSDDSDREEAYSPEEVKFRPIRTDTERDQAIADMRNVVTNFNKTDVIHAIEQLYDAGYRKLSD